MKYLAIFCLILQLLHAAESEFPDLNKHIKLTLKGVNLTNVFDGSQTVSVDGKVDQFILCAPFDLKTPEGAHCDIDYSYILHQAGGSMISGHGK